MSQYDKKPESSIWGRGLGMIVLGILFSLAGTVLFVVAVFQFVCVLAGNEPNTRLLVFGRSLSVYIQQLVDFQTFNSEVKPFPFSDWP
ncbi:DUF4389 domain-containing protein [Sulfurirhabdus autotrophica]|uniref:Uncharacterized protein DUF4389 n=1 Tax=Sulfurirhabdus autotrophica TaxID=1706046 RepID=A0A4R3XWN7_9PROT|nr:DUF4389 domain-containing protein [Sulfurirhabdus autotrophica]TCV83387.1 uncharacterized protein DUF4389 [Sulfurirhabdus autotrophica]